MLYVFHRMWVYFFFLNILGYVQISQPIIVYLKNRDNKFLASSKKRGKKEKEKKITWSAMHVGRMWCHCRMVYLPMSYLYGRRYVGPINGIILSLRRELYTQPYHQINWDQARNLCAKVWFFLRKKIYGKYGICQNFKSSWNYSITFLLQL